MAHGIKVKVYYEDTDAGGVVYYANYLRYMERARTEFLADHGISVADHHNNGIFFVVTHVDINYKKAARLGEVIDVTTEVEEMRNASMTVRNRILREGSLLVDASLTLACIGSDGKPQRLPEQFEALRPAGAPK
ncbi:MAG TPA: tol-pal system-associated acyl-CoA thioesterase [Dissulfurispiraceae bacterium]|nr:tol-pal system-associated acyl-CoA thioesterase [Dissulfurispiraceae bacterium]